MVASCQLMNSWTNILLLSSRSWKEKIRSKDSVRKWPSRRPLSMPVSENHLQSELHHLVEEVVHQAEKLQSEGFSEEFINHDFGQKIIRLNLKEKYIQCVKLNIFIPFWFLIFFLFLLFNVMFNHLDVDCSVKFVHNFLHSRFLFILFVPYSDNFLNLCLFFF